MENNRQSLRPNRRLTAETVQRKGDTETELPARKHRGATGIDIARTLSTDSGDADNLLTVGEDRLGFLDEAGSVPPRPLGTIQSLVGTYDHSLGVETVKLGAG